MMRKNIKNTLPAVKPIIYREAEKVVKPVSASTIIAAAPIIWNNIIYHIRAGGQWLLLLSAYITIEPYTLRKTETKNR